MEARERGICTCFPRALFTRRQSETASSRVLFGMAAMHSTRTGEDSGESAFREKPEFGEVPVSRICPLDW